MMRLVKGMLGIFVLAACHHGAGQAQQPAARDPQAVSILTQVVVASGGSAAIAAINDFTGSGTATYFLKEPTQGSVTIRGLGLQSFRLDASLTGGERSWIVNRGEAWLKNSDGSTTYLPSQNALKPASTMFPLMQIFAALQDSSTKISYGGIVAHDGEQLYEITVAKTFQNDVAGALSRIAQAHIFVQPQAMTVAAIVDKAYAQRGSGEFEHELQFANYQRNNGVLVPLSITELISGQKTVSIQLDEMKFNNALTSADFQ